MRWLEGITDSVLVIFLQVSHIFIGNPYIYPTREIVTFLQVGHIFIGIPK